MSTTISPETPVLVVGGGNCGLAIASGLKKAGVPYILFERDSEDEFLNKARDWGMFLHWGDEYLRKLIPKGLESRMHEARVDPHYEFKPNDKYPNLDADTGEVVRWVQMPVMVRLSRKRLRAFLTEGQNLNIKCNKRLKNMEVDSKYRVMVEFEDGTRAIGSCVIGCDGSRSRVREYLCGERARPVDTGTTMINHVASYTAEQARLLRMYHPISQLAFSHDRCAVLLAVVDASDNEHPENWKFQTFYEWHGPPTATDLQDPLERLRFYKDRASRLCEPFRTAALALKDDEVIPVDAGNQWGPYHWDNTSGRVTLAGDAAHSMLPHRGQGLNNALKDASEVVDGLIGVYHEEKSFKDAIDAYEAEMIPRGAKEVGLTRELADKRVNAKYEDELVRMGLQKPE